MKEMDVNNKSIDDIGLSVRSLNALHREGIHTAGDMLECTEESLFQMKNLGRKSVEEILGKIDEIKGTDADSDVPDKHPVYELMHMQEYQSLILQYVKANDIEIEDLGLSARPKNRLKAKRYKKLSDIVFLTKEDLLKMRAMGEGSAYEILSRIKEYLADNEERIMAIINGDEAAFWDDRVIRKRILDLYKEIGFGGLSFDEMSERLSLPEQVTQKRLKGIIGNLLAENELEYTDYRCYRVYEKFEKALEECTSIEERSRVFISRRLAGDTLEEIAKDHGITRERVRQVVKRDIEKVRSQYTVRTGIKLFDEDYFRYLYETYFFEKKDGIEWLGIPIQAWNYLDLLDIEQGTKSLQAALDDTHGLDLGMRLKIKNYLNRNKLFVNGMWVDKKRADLEELVVRKYCTEDVSYDEFFRLFNEFLDHEDIPYDEDIYYTEGVYRTRKNHLSEARYLLWKQNEQIRYYDIDSRDYTELLEALNLDSYENIEISTVKFLRDNPEVLKKYDIRDQYELHNLLRKIVPKGSYHDFCCGRMPMIKFGSFDRDSAIMDILIDNSPISSNELADMISNEYGYDPAVIIGTYLQNFSKYYHRGIYSVDQKQMSAENKEVLQAALTEDFYYIDEIRRMYRRLFPEADEGEVNPYNLKTMGLHVYSRYVVQHHDSFDAMVDEILTGEDIVDLTPYKKRFVYVQTFNNKLMEMRRSLQIIEFEPNQVINFRRLEQAGITRKDIQAFCDAVYAHVEKGAYFSARSLKQSGFVSKLYELGFSDWFYANLLISDERFSFANMYSNLILYKGKKNITIKSFEMDRIREYGCIDVFDLINELTERFGCKVDDKWDVIYKVKGTEIYYDNILDRLYSNKDLYYAELEGDF